jgi:hypothetical protein
VVNVRVSYSGSNSQRILHDCPPAAQSQLTSAVCDELGGESTAIVWLKVVSSMNSYARADWQSRTARLAESQKIELFSGRQDLNIVRFLRLLRFSASDFSENFPEKFTPCGLATPRPTQALSG